MMSSGTVNTSDTSIITNQYFPQSFPEFNLGKDDWNIWIERLEIHFEDIECTDDKQKRSILLKSMGAEAYAIVRSLCDPKQPREIPYKELSEICQNQFTPPVIIFYERKEFYTAVKNEDESVSAWFARVKSMAIKCKFGNGLDNCVLDRFICGMSGKIFERLCEEDEKVTTAKALKKAIILETKYAQKPINEVNFVKNRSTRAKVHNNNNNNSQRANSYSNKQNRSNNNNNKTKKTPCASCGWKNHEAINCKFKHAVCHNCNQKGHLASVCSQKSNKSKDINFVDSSSEADFCDNLTNIFENSYSNNTGSNAMRESETNDIGAAFSIFSVCAEDVSDVIYKLPVEVDGNKLNIICDTGAPLSLISHGMYEQLFSRNVLKPCSIPFTSYGGNKIPVVGQFVASVRFRDLVKSVSFIVTKTNSQPLLARNFLRAFNFELVQNRKGSLDNTVNTVSSYGEIIDHFRNEFASVFDNQLGAFNGGTVNLPIEKDAKPIFCKPRAVPFAWKGKIEKQLDDLVKSGVLEPMDSSDWGTPLVPILKPNGSIRICGDYKSTVNRSLIDIRYPLPRIEEIFARLEGGVFFTKLDLSNAYNQLLLDEESQKLCAWSTHKGIFKMKRLPFGVKPASAIFQRTIETLLRNIPNVVNYMDDIVVSGSNFDEHVRNCKLVLTRLREVNLKLNLDKCQFFQKKITYLGFNIDASGLSKTDERINSVLQSPIPQNVSELRAFVGLVNYYSRFIPSYADKMVPLYSLLQKENEFVWNVECQSSFEQMKKEVTTDRVLVHFDPKLPIILETDASQYAVAGVLSHWFPDKTKRPIAFVSRSLSKCERNYSVIEKEALAIIFSVTKLRQYLLGQKFELDTDHKPLLAIFGQYKGLPVMASARMQRWAFILSGFNYSINHIKGVENHADSLSRMAQIKSNVANEDQLESSYINYVDYENVAQLDFKQIASETRRDPTMARVLQAVMDGTVDKLIESGFETFRKKGNELSVDSGCVLWGYRAVIPEKFRKRILSELHRSHLGVVKTKSLARSYIWWPKMDSDIENMVNKCHSCQISQASPEKSALIPWLPSNSAWERIHIDFAGPLKGFHFLVIVDSFSKWVEVFKTKSPSTHFVIAKLRETFCRLGLVDTLVSDNGTQFTSSEMREFTHKNRIKHKFTAPGQPSTNGQAEIFVKMLKKSLNANLNENSAVDIDMILNRFLADYRSAKHCTTGESPFKLMFGKEMKTRFSLVKPPLVRERIIESQRKSIANHRGNRQVKFEKGQQVYIRDYTNPNKPSWMKAEIKKKIGTRTFGCIIARTKRYIRRHMDQIRGENNVATNIPGATNNDNEGGEIDNSVISVNSSPESGENSGYLSAETTSTPRAFRPRKIINYKE